MTKFEGLIGGIVNTQDQWLLPAAMLFAGMLLGVLLSNFFKSRSEKSIDELTHVNQKTLVAIQQSDNLNKQLISKAESLTNVLQGDVSAQGSWGELKLSKLLEKSGLKNGDEFKTQKEYKSIDSGQPLRPDCVVFLPESRHVIIDSKVSLVNYQAYEEAKDKDEKEKFRKALVSDVKKQVDNLSDKDYTKLEGLNSADFILMFVPFEGALSLIADAKIASSKEELLKYAFERRVVIVSPSSLFAVLKSVNLIWRKIEQSENTEKIVQRAAKMHDQFTDFLGAMDDISKSLNKAMGAHEDAMRKLQGQQGAIKQAKDIEKLGVQPKHPIP